MLGACAVVPTSSQEPIAYEVTSTRALGLVNCAEFDQYQCFALEEALNELSLHSDTLCVHFGSVASGATLHWDPDTPHYGWSYIWGSEI